MEASAAVTCMLYEKSLCPYALQTVTRPRRGERRRYNQQVHDAYPRARLPCTHSSSPENTSVLQPSAIVCVTAINSAKPRISNNATASPTAGLAVARLSGLAPRSRHRCKLRDPAHRLRACTASAAHVWRVRCRCCCIAQTCWQLCATCGAAILASAADAQLKAMIDAACTA
jgi:hypothetical protein